MLTKSASMPTLLALYSSDTSGASGAGLHGVGEAGGSPTRARLGPTFPSAFSSLHASSHHLLSPPSPSSSLSCGGGLPAAAVAAAGSDPSASGLCPPHTSMALRLSRSLRSSKGKLPRSGMADCVAEICPAWRRPLPSSGRGLGSGVSACGVCCAFSNGLKGGGVGQRKRTGAGADCWTLRNDTLCCGAPGPGNMRRVASDTDLQKSAAAMRGACISSRQVALGAAGGNGLGWGGLDTSESETRLLASPRGRVSVQELEEEDVVASEAVARRRGQGKEGRGLGVEAGGMWNGRRRREGRTENDVADDADLLPSFLHNPWLLRGVDLRGPSYLRMPQGRPGEGAAVAAGVVELSPAGMCSCSLVEDGFVTEVEEEEAAGATRDEEEDEAEGRESVAEAELAAEAAVKVAAVAAAEALEALHGVARTEEAEEPGTVEALAVADVKKQQPVSWPLHSSRRDSMPGFSAYSHGSQEGVRGINHWDDSSELDVAGVSSHHERSRSEGSHLLSGQAGVSSQPDEVCSVYTSEEGETFTITNRGANGMSVICNARGCRPVWPDELEEIFEKLGRCPGGAEESPRAAGRGGVNGRRHGKGEGEKIEHEGKEEEEGGRSFKSVFHVPDTCNVQEEMEMQRKKEEQIDDDSGFPCSSSALLSPWKLSSESSITPLSSEPSAFTPPAFSGPYSSAPDLPPAPPPMGEPCVRPSPPSSPSDDPYAFTFDPPASPLSRKVDLAHAYYAAALSKYPDHPTLLRNYARFLFEVRKDYLMANEVFIRAIEVNPDDGEVLVHYAKLLSEGFDDVELASQYFEKAIELAPDDCYVLAAYASFLWNAEGAKERRECDHVANATRCNAVFDGKAGEMIDTTSC